MNPERVHQEHLTVIRHGVGKMVGDPLMHALAGGPAEYRGQIAACLIEIGGDGAHRPLLTGQIEDAQPRRDQQGCAMQNCASAAQWATGCFYRLRQSRRRGEMAVSQNRRSCEDKVTRTPLTCRRSCPSQQTGKRAASPLRWSPIRRLLPGIITGISCFCLRMQWLQPCCRACRASG